MNGINIFENKKTIEELKINILKNVSALYENMALIGEKRDISYEDIFSDMLINIYILSMRLDIDINKLERKAIDRMRLKLLEGSSLSGSYAELCGHFKKHS